MTLLSLFSWKTLATPHNLFHLSLLLHITRIMIFLSLILFIHTAWMNLSKITALTTSIGYWLPISIIHLKLIPLFKIGYGIFIWICQWHCKLHMSETTLMVFLLAFSQCSSFLVLISGTAPNALSYTTQKPGLHSWCTPLPNCSLSIQSTNANPAVYSTFCALNSSPSHHY